MQTTRFVLIRHGHTESNSGERRLLSGRVDLPLSARGRQEVWRLGERMRGATPFASIYVSPLRRAHDTADPLAHRRAGIARRVQAESTAHPPAVLAGGLGNALGEATATGGTAVGTVLESEATATRTDDGIGLALGREQRPRRTATEPYQRLADEDRGTGGESTADFLGYFSLGLGLAELLAPTMMARLIGVKYPDDRTRTTMRLMGLREIGHGVSILSTQQPSTAVWSRVAGDALDLAFLARTLASEENDRGRTLFATANVLAVTAVDVMNARQLARQPRTAANRRADAGIIHTKRSVTIRRPVEEVYGYWRDFQNLPRFMRHLESVTPLDDRRSHWVARAPAGRTVEWDAELLADEPNERIAWRSLPGSDVHNAGVVRFRSAPGERGTEVRVTLEYEPPFGKLGSKLAMLWGEEPGQQVARDLAHLKQVLETGDIVVSDATKRRGMHPARPDGRPVRTLTGAGQ